MIIELIDEAVSSGARREKACALLGLSERSVARWRVSDGGEDRRRGPVATPAHALTAAVTPNGEVPTLGVRLDNLLLTKGSDGWAVSIIPSEEDDDAEAMAARTDGLRTISGLRVTTPEDDPRPRCYIPQACQVIEPRFLSVEEVLILHADQLERYGGSGGLRDPGSLESAVEMPRASLGRLPGLFEI